MRVERSRQFGGPWIGQQLLQRLELDRFWREHLPAGGEEIPWAVMAQVLMPGRMCGASSELDLAKRFYQASALSDVLGLPADKVNEDRLCRALDVLLPHKRALERHLREKLGKPSELDYVLLLYGAASTHLGRETEKNLPAARGSSPDHRPDSSQLGIALVVSRCGTPQSSSVEAGGATSWACPRPRRSASSAKCRQKTGSRCMRDWRCA